MKLRKGRMKNQIEMTIRNRKINGIVKIKWLKKDENHKPVKEGEKNRK